MRTVGGEELFASLKVGGQKLSGKTRQALFDASTLYGQYRKIVLKGRKLPRFEPQQPTGFQQREGMRLTSYEQRDWAESRIILPELVKVSPPRHGPNCVPALTGIGET
uniref:Transposase n=1 Tax=Ascaris lumbricoides TaxID=6252 RepID=A0A0M3HWV0_ASCLU